MSGLFNNVYTAVVSNPLVNALYHKASPLVSSVYAYRTPIAIFGLLGINLASMALGAITSLVTREYVQLNNFVPESIRKFFRGVGEVIVHANNRVDSQISERLRVRKEFETYREYNEEFKKVKGFIGTVITGPIFEELAFRLPFMLVSWTIGMIAPEFFRLPILEGVDITGAQATKGALTTLSSVAFAYAHDDKPAPHRAAGLFGVGLTLSYLTMSLDEGFMNAIKGLIFAMVAHMIHNFTSLRCGMQKISTGILSKGEKENPLAI